MLFSDEPDASESQYDFPRIRRRSDIELPSDQNNYTTLYPNSTLLRQSMAAQRFFPELSVLLRPSRCCGSILDTFEPVPTLQAAMKKLRFDSALRESVGLNSNILIPFVLYASAAPKQGDMTDWTDWMVRFALQGTDGDGGARVTVGQVIDIDSGAIGRTEPVCFEKLLVPSTPESVFPSKRSAYRFRDDVHRRLSHEKKLLPDGPNTAWLRSYERNGRFVKPAERTVVLTVRRPPLRGADDHNDLSRIVERAVRPAHAIVRGIDCSGHSLVSQATHGQIADIFVSFRGSDLANIIFMKPGRLVVELDSVFGHDPAVRCMARMLGLKHVAWACTRPACAFGGDRSQWDRLKASARFEYDEETDRLSLPGEAPFKWPIGDSVEDNCPACARLTTSDAFRTAGVTNSAVAVRAAELELGQLLRSSLLRVGWFELEVAPRFRAGTGKPTPRAAPSEDLMAVPDHLDGVSSP